MALAAVASLEDLTSQKVLYFDMKSRHSWASQCQAHSFLDTQLVVLLAGVFIVYLVLQPTGSLYPACIACRLHCQLQ